MLFSDHDHHQHSFNLCEFLEQKTRSPGCYRLVDSSELCGSCSRGTKPHVLTDPTPLFIDCVLCMWSVLISFHSSYLQNSRPSKVTPAHLSAPCLALSCWSFRSLHILSCASPCHTAVSYHSTLALHRSMSSSHSVASSRLEICLSIRTPVAITPINSPIYIQPRT